MLTGPRMWNCRFSRYQGKVAEADKHFENALALARGHRPEDPLPESEGLTAGRLAEIITALREAEAARSTRQSLRAAH